MTLAKGLGGGVPIGAFLAKEAACVFKQGEHGSTFGGNPLVCAAGYAVLSYIIDNHIPGHVQKVSSYLYDGLVNLAGKYDAITGVRGKGLLLALGLKDEISADLVLKCMEKGLLVNNVKPDALRLMPPLVVTEKDIRKALDILDKVFKERQ